MAEKEKYSGSGYITTTNLKLSLPCLDELADISVINDNFDIIDKKLGKVFNDGGQTSQVGFKIQYPEGKSAANANPEEAYGTVDLICPDTNIYDTVLVTIWSIKFGVCQPITLFITDISRSTPMATIGFPFYPEQDKKEETTGADGKKTTKTIYHANPITWDNTNKTFTCPFKGELSRAPFSELISENDDEKVYRNGIRLKLMNPTPLYTPNDYGKDNGTMPKVLVKAIWLAYQEGDY